MMRPTILILYGLILMEVKLQSALNITECSSGTITVTEGSNISLTCSLYKRQLEWDFSPDYPSRFYIGKCNRRLCYIPKHRQFRMYASFAQRHFPFYKGTLEIVNVNRQDPSIFRCSDPDTKEIASCRIQVIASASIVPGTCRVTIHSWHVHGTCAVEGMLTSNVLHTCSWLLNNSDQIESGFEDSLSQYIFDNINYWRGSCSFSTIMPVARGRYTYSFAINPPQPKFFSRTIEIVPPGEPHHDCPEVVNEQSTVSCKCTSLNPGSPPAEIVWDGMFDNSNTLLIQTVEQQSTVNSYTCRLTWGPEGVINRTVVYTFKVVGTVTSGTTGAVISGTTGTVISGTTATVISGTTGTVISGTTGTVISGTTGTATSGTTGTVIFGTTATVISGTTENKPSAGSAVLIGTTVGVLAALVIIIFIILMIIRLKCPVYCKAKRPLSEEHTYDDIADVEQSPHYDRLTRQETDEHHYETAANVGGNCSKTAGKQLSI
ncbi:uncharacterized protein LOC112568913 isoform X2 [Pomacea canaliculata]|uniref:uncharacterized protein LOC112568913 isoform X2 n=1 Tax=Pomacea canaliculata TaxID=400727 RepID=UPI000D72664A|nr:uncharacterized protein LOC112568913 isoform X2 [Pomacea canaliculata]